MIIYSQWEICNGIWNTRGFKDKYTLRDRVQNDECKASVLIIYIYLDYSKMLQVIKKTPAWPNLKAEVSDSTVYSEGTEKRQWIL